MNKSDGAVDFVMKVELIRASLVDVEVEKIKKGEDVISAKIAPLLKAVDDPDELMRVAIVCFWLSRSHSSVNDEVFMKSFNAIVKKMKDQKQRPQIKAALLEIKKRIIVDGEISFWFDDL